MKHHKLVLAAVLACGSSAAWADQPGKHPAYLHALDDLRAARAHLERPASVTVKWDEKVAIKEIDDAIKEIKDAAIDDGKNLADHPPVDAKMDWRGRLGRALELVQKAHQDVDQEEDNNFARGLKKRALQHIDLAAGFVKEGITDAGAMAGGGGDHPAYLHALSDLRHVRALLARPANAWVKWDEKLAIREVDAAIGEIKKAAIDDGKPLDDHPPVDAGMEWGGRLHKADELVAAARADVNEKEDDKFARGLKRRALQHLDAADKLIKDGIENMEMPQRHPAYLHALSDLRVARAHLEKPANAMVKWDEKTAIREIDAAIKEIKLAAIDDGKPLEDHPPVDIADWGGRLQKALELVDQARADVSEKEDDKFARGVKKRAIGHLDMASRFIKQGIANAQPH